jgi:predicted phosphohydrolase
MVSIALLSDIHLEYDDPQKKLSSLTLPPADILVCAGDLGSPFSKAYRDLIAYVTAVYDYVIVIAGNHEYHAPSPCRIGEHSLCQTEQAIRDVCHHYGAYALQRSFVDILGIRFYGCVLWSDPLATGGEKYWTSRSDYQHIQELTTPQDYLRQHRQDVRWLERVLQADDFKGPRMVVTHHLPSLQLIEPRYQTPTPNRNGYYASD